MNPDEEILDIISLLESARREGRCVTPEDACSSHPELLPALRDKLLQIKSLDHALGFSEPHTAETLNVLHTEYDTQLTIPGYEILDVLGEGGMGIVYRARQIRAKRIVALKMLGKGLCDSRYRSRLEKEVEALARLQHENIVQVYEVGESAGQHFFTMELMPNGTLSNRLKQSPLLLSEIVALVEKLARAMHIAHASHVLHRDLKPQNILLDANNEPKISDFGLAKFIDQTERSSTTLGGLGTPSYMSWEQAFGAPESIGPAADIYSLSAILYECLTGRPPFRGISSLDTLDQLRTKEIVPVRVLQPSVPRDLETICMKALRKDPTERYNSMKDFAEDLLRFQENRPIQANPVGVVEKSYKFVRRYPYYIGLGLLACLGLFATAGIFIYHTLQIAKSEEDAATSRRMALNEKFHSDLEKIRRLRINPKPGWTVQTLRIISDLMELPDAKDLMADLRTEAIAALTAIDPIPVKEIAKGFWGYYPVYHPNGKWIAIGDWFATSRNAGHVILVDLESGEIFRTLIYRERKGYKKPDGIRVMTFSPDGRWLIAGASSGDLHRWDLDSTVNEAFTLNIHDEEVRKIIFTSNGTKFYSCSNHSIAGVNLAGSYQRRESPEKDINLIGLGESPKPWIAFRIGNTFNRVLQADWNQDMQSPTAIADHCFTSLDGKILFEHASDSIRVRSSEGNAYDFFSNSNGDLFNESPPEQFLCDPSYSIFLIVFEASREIKLFDISRGQVACKMTIESRDFSLRSAFSPDGIFLTVCEGKKTRIYELHRATLTSSIALSPQKKQDFVLAYRDRILTYNRKDDFAQGQDVNLWDSDRNYCTNTASITLPHHFLLHGMYGNWRNSLVSFYLEDLLSKSYLLKIIPLEKFGAPENAMLTSGVSKQKQIKSILFDTGNTIWLGYNYGIVRNHLQNSQLTALYQLHDRDTEISTGNNWKVFGLGSDFILAGRRYGTLHRFDKKLKNELSLKVTEDSIESLALAPIDQIAVFGTSRGELLWLNPQNMEVRRRIDDAHGQLITSVHFLNDKILASSSLDRTIKIWNRTGKEIATLITPSPIHKMEVDKAGSKIFTLSRNERGLRVWDLKELKAKLTEIHPQLGWDD